MWTDSTESWYTYSFSFENATFSLRIRLPSTRILCNENRTFRQRSLELNFLKTLFSRVPVYRRERNFSKTLRTHYQVQSTPSNIRNLFKMADGRFPFLSFILGLISNLIACLQANSASLILQADYSRRRQNMIRLLSLPVSRGGRLDLPLVWLWPLCILFCSCEVRPLKDQIQYHPRPPPLLPGWADKISVSYF